MKAVKRNKLPVTRQISPAEAMHNMIHIMNTAAHYR